MKKGLIAVVLFIAGVLFINEVLEQGKQGHKKQIESSPYFDRPITCRVDSDLDIYFTSLSGLYDFQRHVDKTNLSKETIKMFLKAGQAQYIPRHNEIVCVAYHGDNAAEIRIDGRIGYVPKDWLQLVMTQSGKLEVQYNDVELIIDSPSSYDKVTVEINTTGMLKRGYKVNLKTLKGGRTVIPLREFVNSEGLRFDSNKYALTDIAIRTTDPSAKEPSLGYFKTH